MDHTHITHDIAQDLELTSDYLRERIRFHADMTHEFARQLRLAIKQRTCAHEFGRQDAGEVVSYVCRSCGYTYL